MTTRWSLGTLNPQAEMAQRTRAGASPTAESGIPTREIPGMPEEHATSTETGRASAPLTQAPVTQTEPPIYSSHENAPTKWRRLACLSPTTLMAITSKRTNETSGWSIMYSSAILR